MNIRKVTQSKADLNMDDEMNLKPHIEEQIPMKSMNQTKSNTLLTKEEEDGLKPKDVKVENPWIYEQTHQEYLENIKVSLNLKTIWDMRLSLFFYHEILTKANQT